METEQPPANRPTAPSRLRFSLKALLVIMLVVASYFAGRASMMTQLQQIRVEAEQQRARADAAQDQMRQTLVAFHLQLAQEQLNGDASALRLRLLKNAGEQRSWFEESETE